MSVNNKNRKHEEKDSHTDVTISDSETAPKKPGKIARAIGGLASLLVGIFVCTLMVKGLIFIGKMITNPHNLPAYERPALVTKKSLLEEINKYRAKNDKKPLTLNEGLSRSAQKRCESVRNNKFRASKDDKSGMALASKENGHAVGYYTEAMISLRGSDKGAKDFADRIINIDAPDSVSYHLSDNIELGLGICGDLSKKGNGETLLIEHMYHGKGLSL